MDAHWPPDPHTAPYLSTPKTGLDLLSSTPNQGVHPSRRGPLLRALARFHGNAARPRGSGPFPPQLWGPHHAGRAGQGGASGLCGPVAALGLLPGSPPGRRGSSRVGEDLMTDLHGVVRRCA